MLPTEPSSTRPRRGSLLAATAAGTALLTLVLLATLAYVRTARQVPPLAEAGPVAVPSVAAPVTPEPPALRMSVLTVRLGRNQTLVQALARLQLAPAQIQGILEALKGKLPFHRAQPGDQLRVERVEGGGPLRRFTYRQSAADEWTVVPEEGGALRGQKRQVALTTELARVEVEIRGSVWESLQKAGEDPALAVSAADVLAWDVDFYQDVHPSDRLKVLVEKIYADGKLLRLGEVQAIEYSGVTTGRRRLFRYTDPSGQTSYYDDAGNNARRGLLKSPLKYAHLTSGYGSRLHPVLGYVRAHQGVDYGAPTGTPVWAVGDGQVLNAGWQGGCGKAVTLRHGNGLETVYCHLSRLNVAAGARVSQKQVIGLVGTTGLSTGPHLHYAVRRGGSFVNPLSIKLPRPAPLGRQYRADFDARVAPLRARLDAGPIA